MMLDHIPPLTAALRLYQVSYEAWTPPTIVAAMAPDRAAAIAAYGTPVESSSLETVVIDVTDEFLGLSPIAASHVQALISGRVEGVVNYDAEDGWAYDALR
jgi:hypothetical protein